jgi:Helix-turn-helix domain
LRRSYKFLLRPTAHQRAALEACLEDTRQLYNAALEERREAWRMGQHRITFYSQDAQLKEIRKADPERFGRWAFSCERAAIRRLDRAFAAFYRRVKAGEKPGYPRFKGRGWFNSVEWEARSGARWDTVPHPTVTRVYMLGIGHVRVHQHRAVKGTVKTIAVKREGSRWYVVLSCDDVPAEPLEPIGATVGIDMGVASFLTRSDGTHVPNPRPLAVAANRLAAAQRSLARKQPGRPRPGALVGASHPSATPGLVPAEVPAGLPERPVSEHPQQVVLHFHWEEASLQRQETYGPWAVADDGMAHLAEIRDFIADWQRLTGIKPHAVTMALVIDPAEWLRDRH